MPRFPRSQALVAALGLAALPVASLRAQEPVTVPILLSISGAASLGTYQSGATWAIIRYMQLADGDAALRPASRPNVRFRLGALSGTSAGNINALISALESCRVTPVRPENSLYAQLWLATGLGQLNPLNAPNVAQQDFANGGLISRDFFHTLWDSLTTAMRRPLWDPSCDLPVGISMTRIIPAMYALQRSKEDSSITASTQRFVARWRVVADPPPTPRAPTTISLLAPAFPTDARVFGAEYLIDAGRDAIGRDTVDRRIVVRAVEASASVPLIWAAVNLPAPLDSNWAARQRRAPDLRPTPRVRADSALFVDGGVFDSDPLSLAVDLWNEEPPPEAGRKARALLVRLDPTDVRGVLLLQQQAASQPPPTTIPSAGGLDPAFTLLKGGIAAARDYELQSLGRALAAATRDSTAPRIVHVTRAFPAMAEHLGTFAGFLGRPFRDHDFVLGIYDGLRFVARELVCADPTSPNPSVATAQCVDSVLTRSLIPAVNRTLPGGAPVPLVSAFARCESRGLRDADCAFGPEVGVTDSLTEARDAVMRSLARANQQLLSFSPAAPSAATPQCGPRPCDTMAASMIWGDGFGSVLRTVSADTSYRRAMATIRRTTGATHPACWTSAAAFGSADPTCPADSAFVRLIHDPEPQLDAMLRFVLRRLSAIEAAPPGGSALARRTAAIAELAYTAQEFPMRRTFFAPTTVPSAEPSHLAWNLVPYYLSVGVNGISGVETGWNYTLRYWRDAHLGLTAPVSLWHRDADGNTKPGDAAAAGLGLFVRSPTPAPWLNAQLSLQYSTYDGASGLWGARSLTGEVAWMPPVISFVRVGYRVGALGDGGIWSVGIVNLPGLAYWGWRLF